MIRVSNKLLWLLLPALLALGAYTVWQRWQQAGPGPGFVSGNGRLEATEIDIATKTAGRLTELLVAEGDWVQAGQPLARMQTDTLQAQRDEAVANVQRARQAVLVAQAQVALRESDHQAALAAVVQRQSELDAAQRRLQRSQALAQEGATSAQELDDDRARVRNLQAVLRAAQAQAAAAQQGIAAARIQVDSAQTGITAAQATLARTDVELADTELKAPRAGRVQFVVAQAGEVLGAGGKVLNLVDLADVSMTFFLPETVAGQVALGSEVRLVLDAAPQSPLPAQVSFVASTAQFTPKTVETASERQKLMFRVKARIAPELLQQHPERIKTGLPGVAWLKLDPQAAWPEALAAKDWP